jgi:uncharacterized protein
LRLATMILVATFCLACGCATQQVPRAIIADPPPDAKSPARMEAIHVPSGGVQINGVVYVASGPSPHPTVVLFHGLPGNEKNLDLAQAARRAGWTVVTVNYRGSWGSPGNYKFAQDLEDARATLAYIRVPANAKRLSIDVNRIALVGHSVGGWVTAQTLASDVSVLGAVIISAVDVGALGLKAQQNRAAIIAVMNDNREALAGVTGDSMTDELMDHGTEWSFSALAPKLTHQRLLVLYSEDFAKGDSIALLAAIKADGGTTVTAKYVTTDHQWSDHRIALESLVISWLNSLPTQP